MFCLPSLASCAAGCLGSFACCALSSGHSDDFKVSKFLAMLLQLFSTALILVVQATDTPSWLSKVAGIKECGEDANCYSVQIAYRIGFATACVFAFHLVLSLLGRCMANKALNSYWIFKFFFVVGGAAAMMFIPNGFFNVWGGIAGVALGWFLVIQMIWIIDFAFSWNDLWITNAAEDRAASKSGKSWYIGILFFAVVFLAGAYVTYGILFKDYGDMNEYNRAVLGVNVGVSTGLGLLSVFSPRGGILPASLVILYVAWLSWSTMVSSDSLYTSNARMAIGITLAGIILIYSTSKAHLPQVASDVNKDATVPEASAPQADTDDAPVPAAAPTQEAAMEQGESQKKEEPKRSNDGSWRLIFFINSMHLSAACYLMTLCLTWTKSTEGGDQRIAYWVQAVSAWAMLLVYSWTLVAPIVCRSRQF
jgi:hypothetical protein